MYVGKNLERVPEMPLGLMVRVIPSSVPSINHAWSSTMASAPCDLRGVRIEVRLAHGK